MKIKTMLLALVAVVFAVATLTQADTGKQAREEMTRVQDAIGMLKEAKQSKEMDVPRQALRDAAAVAIIPNMIKGAFLVGGERGSGVLLVKNGKGEWSDPVFISATGASVGAQLGVEATDMLLVFNNRKSVDDLIGGELKLGADATVAAGDLNASMQATAVPDVVVFKRSGGAFAGASVSGAILQVVDDANREFYGSRDITTAQILAGLDKARDAGISDRAEDLNSSLKKELKAFIASQPK